MKILIPVLGFGKSGGYRTLSRLADECISHGAIVSFMAPVNSEKPYFPTRASVIWVNKTGQVLTSNDPGGNAGKGFIFIQRALVAGLKKVKKDFDVFVGNQSMTTLPLYLAGLRSRSIYYVQAYEPEYYASMPGIRNKILFYLARLSYRLLPAMIVNAPVYKRYREIKSETVVLPGLDLSLFVPVVKDIPRYGPVRMGTIGRFEKYKGSAIVLEAFLQLQALGYDVELHVAYSTREQWNIQNEKVFFHTPANDTELAAFYSSLDVYVCAGHLQFGAVHYPVIESMATGIMLITTPYYPASVNNCYLVEKATVQAIADVFKQMMNDSDDRHRSLREQAIVDTKQFAWSRVGQIMYNKLNELVNGK